MNIQLMKPNVGEDEIALVKQVIESGYLVEGPMVRECEALISNYVKAKHTIACTSWTTGAELVFRAIGIKEGDEVICPDFTHPATALSVITAGGTPVFVDVDLESRNITADRIAEAITDKTRAIQPVSIFGNPVDIDPINELARENDLVVIDDAACTLGSHYKGKPVGGLTDFTIYSFHPRKVFTCGDGGMIATNNDQWANSIRSMKIFGSEGGDFSNWGTNQRMSNIHGAVLLGQFKRIDEIVEARISRSRIYDRLLSSIPYISIPNILEDNISNYQTYAILLDKDKFNSKKRSIIMSKMKDSGIQTQIGTFSISHTPYLSNYRKVGKLSNSKLLSENLLALPLHHELSPSDQEYVVESLHDTIQNLI